MKKLNNQTISQLQKNVAAGDQRAYEDLYRLFYARLYTFALLTLHRKELAEEAVNDVMIKIWSDRERLPAVKNLETYLFVAVRNQSLNYLSKYSHIHVSLEEPGHQAEIINLNDPNRELEWKEMHFRLNDMIDRLPEQCRTVFRLIKEEGFRYKQVGEILNISPRTVETQLYRAVQRLRKVIDEFADQLPDDCSGKLLVWLIPVMSITLF